jgi:peroxiredoxin
MRPAIIGAVTLWALPSLTVADAQTPEYYGVYALHGGQLIEIPSSQPSNSFFSPDDTGLLRAPAQTYLPDGKVMFVAYRRDLSVSAPDSVFISIVAQVARGRDVDQSGNVTSVSNFNNLWKVRDRGYKFRVAPYSDNREMILIRPEDNTFVLPSGRYLFTLFGRSYDFVVEGHPDEQHCVERISRAPGTILMPNVSYEECLARPIDHNDTIRALINAPVKHAIMPSFAAISVGQKAPAFSVVTTNGRFSIDATRGRLTLLTAFATWSPHCQREVATLNDLYARYKGRVYVLGVSASPYAMNSVMPETEADVLAFARTLGVRYPISFDARLDVAHKYLQGGFPTIVLIGKDDTILAIGSGEIPVGALQTALDSALDGRSVDPTFGSKKL